MIEKFFRLRFIFSNLAKKTWKLSDQRYTTIFNSKNLFFYIGTCQSYLFFLVRIRKYVLNKFLNGTDIIIYINTL